MLKKLTLILFTALLLSFIPNQNEKGYGAHATIQEWNILLSHPDDVSKNQRDKVLAKFVAQLQIQVIDTTKKK